jgi:tetratricopeptide (TPR) repeat protein
MPEGFEMSDDDLWKATKSPDLDTRADALFELGERFRNRDDFAEAKNVFAAALDLYKSLDRLPEVVRSTYNLGFCLYQLDKYEEAINNLTWSLEYAKELNDASAIAYSAGPLADSLSALGRAEEEIEAYDLAIDAFVEIEENIIAALNAKAVGDLHGQAGRPSGALECFIRSYNLFQTAGDAQGSARAKDRIAAALIDLGDYEQAISHLAGAFNVFQFIEEEERCAYTKYRIVWTYNLAEQYDQAEAPLREAIAWFRQNELWSRAALAEMQLCESLIFQDLKVENEEVKKLLPRIIDYFEFAGEQANVIFATSLEASRLLQLGLFSQAVEAWYRLLVEASNLGDSFCIGQVRLNLAEALVGDGQKSLAIEQLSLLPLDAWKENKPAMDRYQTIRSSAEKSLTL